MLNVPADLRKLLSANTSAKAKWNALTPIGQRDFISWIESAKQSETRKRRVDSVPSRLASGKRRPCCFAVVPMDFYKAIGELPKAKAQWSSLSADEKRDVTDWIGQAKDKAEKQKRIEKACVLLVQGKRRP